MALGGARGPRCVAGEVTLVCNCRGPLCPQRLAGGEKNPDPQRWQQREKRGVRPPGESPSLVSKHLGMFQ